jgi:hypothetical protein
MVVFRRGRQHVWCGFQPTRQQVDNQNTQSSCSPFAMLLIIMFLVFLWVALNG